MSLAKWLIVPRLFFSTFPHACLMCRRIPEAVKWSDSEPESIHSDGLLIWEGWEVIGRHRCWHKPAHVQVGRVCWTLYKGPLSSWVSKSCRWRCNKQNFKLLCCRNTSLKQFKVVWNDSGLSLVKPLLSCPFLSLTFSPLSVVIPIINIHKYLKTDIQSLSAFGEPFPQSSCRSVTEQWNGVHSDRGYQFSRRVIFKAFDSVPPQGKNWSMHAQ